MLGRVGLRLGSRSGMLPCSSTILEGNQRSFAVLSGKGMTYLCTIACIPTSIVDFIAAHNLVCTALSLVALHLCSQWYPYGEAPASWCHRLGFTVYVRVC